MKSLTLAASGGRKLNAVDFGGSGAPLLLVHGMAAHSHWWDACAPELAKSRRVVALDLSGHGESGWRPDGYSFAGFAQDIEDARIALGWERFYLAGHSLGGRVGLRYAVLHPERLERLAALDFLCEFSQERHARFEIKSKRRAPSYSSQEALLSRFRLQPEGTTASPEALRELAGHSGRQTPDGRWAWKFDWTAFLMDYEAVWDDAAQVKVPVLVVRGEHSLVMPPRAYAKVCKLIPGVKGQVLAGAHHHMTLDTPSETVKAILDFAG